jgi:palmitoyl-protein thioesterase
VTNPDFQGEFNVVGLSQGALLARYMVEECDMPGKVRNLLSFGGPHMGVDSVPSCTSGMMCEAINYIAKKLVYTNVVQNWLAPAGYFRDTRHLSTYEKDSVFLPALNNEMPGKSAFADTRKAKFEAINSAMFVMFEDDTILYPKESAWFQTMDKHSKNLLPLNATDFYNEDFVGLKYLVDNERAHFVSVPGDHLTITSEQMDSMFIPFLN